MEKRKWENTYVQGANGREVTFANGGSIINVSIPEKSLGQLDSFVTKKGDKILTFKLSALRNGQDQYGNTHSVFISKPVDSPQGSPNDGMKEINDMFGDAPTVDDTPF